MGDLDQQLERAQADGRITTHDADEVRNFGEFLREVAGTPTSGGTPEQVWTRRIAYARHYPDDCREAMSDALWAETLARMTHTRPPTVDPDAATARGESEASDG